MLCVDVDGVYMFGSVAVEIDCVVGMYIFGPVSAGIDCVVGREVGR